MGVLLDFEPKCGFLAFYSKSGYLAVVQTKVYVPPWEGGPVHP